MTASKVSSKQSKFNKELVVMVVAGIIAFHTAQSSQYKFARSVVARREPAKSWLAPPPPSKEEASGSAVL